MKSDFEQIFFTNEYRALAGQGKRTVWTLAAILFFTFLALGFGFGGLRNLEQKMQDPFTNWVNVEIGGSVLSRIEKANDALETGGLNEKYHLIGSVGYCQTWFKIYGAGFDPFRHRPDTLLFQRTGRSIEPSEALLEKIVDPKGENLVADHLVRDEKGRPVFEGCGIIVREEMLRGLGFEGAASVKKLLVRNEDRLLALQVLAVVKDLPNHCQFIFTPRLYNIHDAYEDEKEFACKDLILKNSDGTNVFSLFSKTENETALNELAQKHFPGTAPAISGGENLDFPGGTAAQFRFVFEPTNAPSLENWEVFEENVKKSGIPTAPFALLECAEKCNGINSPHYVAYHFRDLEKIRDFQAFLAKPPFEIELDMAQVQAKENFSLVSALTKAILLILLGFAIAFVVLFVNNLIKTHLLDVRPNLGTFQAFGLSNRFLTDTYLRIVVRFLGIACAGSFLAASVFGLAENMVRGRESIFSLFNFWVLAAAAALFAVSLWVTRRSIHKILDDTPGNLIYGR